MEIIEISPSFVALVPVVLGLTQIFKQYADSKWSPLFAVATGVVLAFAVGGVLTTSVIIQGLLIGLTASGIYSGHKSVTTPTSI